MSQLFLFVFGLFLPLLFGRVRIHYLAYYSNQIEYEWNIRYSPSINGVIVGLTYWH